MRSTLNFESEIGFSASSTNYPENKLQKIERKKRKIIMIDSFYKILCIRKKF